MKKLIISSVEDSIVDIYENDKYQSFPALKVKAEDLLKVISERLGKNKMQGVDEILVNMGPGSFTGIRAGLSLVFGLTAGTKTKIIPFTTFDMFEYNKLTAKQILVVNGFSNFVYVKYMSNRKSVMECIEIEKLAKLASDKGMAIFTYSALVIEKLLSLGVEAQKCEISVKNALDKCLSGKLEKIKVEPIYLRLSQAEMQKKEKQK